MKRSMLGIAAAVAALGMALAGGARADQTVTVAFGDVPSVESLAMLVAFERARERGVTVELVSVVEEDIAAQVVVSGQADIGIGTPYAMIQKVKAPIRMFLQMSVLRFYPVVNTEFYREWKDLDGQEIAVHSRGSGTEAIMKLMAQKHGIAYSSISYVPGSEVRAGAMLEGTIKATIVDAANRRLLEEKAPGRFAVLPIEGVNATDEALYASTEFLTEHAAAVDVIVEELLKVAREVTADPASIVKLREQYGLLPDLPADLAAEIEPYFAESAAAQAFPANGGSAAAAQDDLAFYGLAGQLEGDPASLNVADFWDFGPTERAVAKLGQ